MTITVQPIIDMKALRQGSGLLHLSRCTCWHISSKILPMQCGRDNSLTSLSFSYFLITSSTPSEASVFAQR